MCTNFCSLLDNAFVIFDADVDDACLSQIKNQEYFLRLPDEKNYALERRIIYYIVSLENNHQFFEKFKKEKTIFLAEFKDAGIKSLALKDIAKCKIDKCKNWAKSAKKDFEKYVGYYCNHELKKEQFIKDFIQHINLIRVRRGLPKISE